MIFYCDYLPRQNEIFVRQRLQLRGPLLRVGHVAPQLGGFGTAFAEQSLREHPGWRGHARDAQERYVQLQSGVSESADLTDQTEDAPVRGRQLPGKQMVLALD